MLCICDFSFCLTGLESQLRLAVLVCGPDEIRGPFADLRSDVLWQVKEILRAVTSGDETEDVLFGEGIAAEEALQTVDSGGGKPLMADG